MAMEVFVDDLVGSSAAHAAKVGKKKLGVAELRATVAEHSRFDFLKTVEVAEPAAKMPYKKRKSTKEAKASDKAEISSSMTSATHGEALQGGRGSSQGPSIFDTGTYFIPGATAAVKKEDSSDESESDYD